jgi:hypothetical protein
LCLAPSKDFQTLLSVIYKVMTIVHKQAYGRFPMGGHVTKRFLAHVNRRRLLRLLAGTWRMGLRKQRASILAICPNAQLRQRRWLSGQLGLAEVVVAAARVTPREIPVTKLPQLWRQTAQQQQKYLCDNKKGTYVLSWHVPWIENVLTRPFFSSTRGVISLQSLLNAASRSVFKAGGRKSGAWVVR